MSLLMAKGDRPWTNKNQENISKLLYMMKTKQQQSTPVPQTDSEECSQDHQHLVGDQSKYQCSNWEKGSSFKLGTLRWIVVGLALLVLALTLLIKVGGYYEPIRQVKIVMEFLSPEREIISLLYKSAEERLKKQEYGQLKQTTFKQHVREAVSRLEPEVPFFHIQQIQKIGFKQLPICLISRKSQSFALDYQNIKHVVMPTKTNYFDLKKYLNENCKQFQLYVFMDSLWNFLGEINKEFQSKNIWAMGLTNKNNNLKNIQKQNNDLSNKNISELAATKIVAVYRTVLNLVGQNDFDKNNFQYLNSTKQYEKYTTLAILQLAAYHYKELNIQKYYITPCIICIPHPLPQNIIKRTTYQPLHDLSQDHKIDIKKLNRNFYILLQDNPYLAGSSSVINNKLYSAMYSMVDNLKASQDMQLYYLPKNHTLFQRQLTTLQKHLKNLPTLSPTAQTRLCITVLNRNNIQHNRYIKAMNSILLQNYTNYHIVFVDDVSTDNTMQMVIKMMKQKKFTDITYVQNKQRRYATYNIINAAYSFCKQKQVQVLIDGDDELIGTLAFQYVNSMYERQDGWVGYSGYKDDDYVYGYSQRFTDFQKINQSSNNTRKIHHMMSPIRTWRVELVRRIPFSHSKVNNKTWLQSGYDNGIQVPLFQMAGVQKVKYRQQMLYLSKRGYGGNDDATMDGIKIREVVLNYVKGLEPLETLDNFQMNSEERREVENNMKELKEDQGKYYEVVGRGN